MSGSYLQPFLDLALFQYNDPILAFLKDSFPQEGGEVRNNMGAIVSSMIYLPAVAVSRDKSWYSRRKGPEWYRYKSAVRAQDELSRAGLVRVSRGHRAREGYEKGRSTVLYREPRLEELVRRFPLERRRFDFQGEEPVALNRKAVGIKEICSLNGEVSREVKTAMKNAFWTMEDLNFHYFSKVEVGIAGERFKILPGTRAGDLVKMDELQILAAQVPSNVFLTRMFTNRGGGRLYQRSTSYQQLPKVVRREMLINGNKIGEWDFSGMHINLAYAISGKQNPFINDPYSPVVEKLGLEADTEVREAIKRVVLIAFNTEDPQRCATAMIGNHLQDYRVLRQRGIEIRRAHEAFCEVHEPIEKLFSQGIASEIIMLHESSIMQNILRRLAFRGVSVLPLHDSIMGEVESADLIPEIMQEEYERYTRGKRIHVKRDY